jgi:hypothetical protein
MQITVPQPALELGQSAVSIGSLAVLTADSPRQTQIKRRANHLGKSFRWDEAAELRRPRT